MPRWNTASSSSRAAASQRSTLPISPMPPGEPCGSWLRRRPSEWCEGRSELDDLVVADVGALTLELSLDHRDEARGPARGVPVLSGVRGQLDQRHTRVLGLALEPRLGERVPQLALLLGVMHDRGGTAERDVVAAFGVGG